MSLMTIVKNISDPRKQTHSLRHSLEDILAITICANLCGANTWVGVEAFAEAQKDWFEKFLDLSHGIPSHDTLGRVFSLLKPSELEKGFVRWVTNIVDSLEDKLIHIDGKTLRRSGNKRQKNSATHTVNAWCSELGLALGQIKTSEKSNEITAIPEVLRMLDLKGCIVTIDAMGCQTKIADQITEEGADYVLALKGNQGQFHEDIALFLDEEIDNKPDDLMFFETIDKGHGRIETRKYWVSHDINWLKELHPQWSSVSSICAVDRVRILGEKETSERQYYISSGRFEAEQWGQSIRSHWSVENGLHWVLDVAFREDECRSRLGHSATNMAVIRKMNFNALKQDKSTKIGTESKRLKCAVDIAYREKVLGVNTF